MSLGTYIRAFYGLALEIEQSLSESDIESARHSLSADSESSWQRWMIEHETEIFEFLSSTPSKRAKRKTWANNHTRVYLSLAALLYARRSIRLTKAAEQCVESIGTSYRNALAHGAEVCSELLFDVDSNWPFRGIDPWGKPHPLDYL